MGSLKDAVLALREDVLLAAEANEQRTMQKCAQTLMAATALKMLASRMEKTAISAEKLVQASSSARKRAGVANRLSKSLKSPHAQEVLDEVVDKRLIQEKKFLAAANKKNPSGNYW